MLSFHHIGFFLVIASVTLIFGFCYGMIAWNAFITLAFGFCHGMNAWNSGRWIVC
jgi:hypothetical protein